MIKFNDKLVLKVGDKFLPVTCARDQISLKSKSLWVSPAVGPSFWAKFSDLITLKEYASIKTSAESAPMPTPAPINLANPQEFADALAKLESAEAIQELCDRLCDRLFTKGQEYTAKSRSNKLAPYSKLVKELPVVEGVTGFYQAKQDGSQWLRHLYYKYTGIANTNWAEINKNASQKVVENLADQKLLDAKRYEQCVSKLLISEQVWEIGAGLIAASGRRPIEIVVSGKFEVDGEALKFGGQAKKRDENFNDYYIPLIGCTPELFVEKLAAFRNLYQIKNHLAKVDAGEFAEGKEADNIRIQINRLGIAPILAWIPVEKNAPTCSDLRAAWVAIVESKYKDDSKYSLLYRSEILGHKLNVGSVPALNYSRYAVESKSNFVADLREVEEAVETWEKEEAAIEQAPVFKIGDRVLWCDLPAIIADIRGRNCGVGYDYLLKNDGGKHWSGWSQGLNKLVARVDELPASQKSAIENQQQITAISLHQPWASLIASKHKCYETRSWPTKYRGPIAIHAAKKIEEDPRLLKLLGIPASEIPRGAIVAIADLVDCVQMDAAFIEAQSDTERMCGDWSARRWAWKLENVRAIEPVAARGMQGLWQWDMPEVHFLSVAELLPEKSEILTEQTQTVALLPKELTIDSSLTIIADISGRHEFDFYETPPWLTLLALANVPLSGTIGECCVGHGAIASILQMAGLKTWANDIDPAKQADYHSDATLPESWEQLPPADWIVTNPPYAEMSSPIVKNAYAHASKGIVTILRQNWIEGCDDRRDFLKAHPPTLAISVPRYCYRKGKPDKNGVSHWATDQCPTWVYVWEKSNKSGLTKIITLGAEDIPLFHRTPEGIPSVEAIEAEVQRIMGSKPVEKSNCITQIMLQFMEQNAGDRRVYVGQTVVAKLCKIGNNKANIWIKEHRELLAKHNKGLNPFVTR